jgi:predicted P-loop ATPase
LLILCAKTHSSRHGAVKAFLSCKTDRFRPPYGRRLIEAPRQYVFAGTVNHAEYLKDDTGGRRFWPMRCGTIDTDALGRDKEQIWAEAVVRYDAGERWWLDKQELIAAAAEAQEARYSADPWEPCIEEWLRNRDRVTTADALEGPISKPSGQWTRGDAMRVGEIYRRLGWHPTGRSARQVGRSRFYERVAAPSLSFTGE